MIKITTTAKQELKTDKLKVDIYVPLNLCSCMYESFINRTFTVLTEYLKFINFETKSLESEEAYQLGLKENCVVLDGNIIINNSFKLKSELPKLLKQKGLL